MRPDPRRAWTVLAFLLAAALPVPQAAAQEFPDVEVDMSVLEAMQPAGSRESYYSTPARPVLTRVPATAGNVPLQQNKPEDLVYFPVKVKERSELLDPMLEKAVPASAPPKEAAKPFNPPLPDLKPIESARQAVKPVTPPLPPRRPDIQQASMSFISEAKMAAALELGAAAANMPAVPAKTVDKEALIPPPGPAFMANDALAQSLIEPGRMEMVEKLSAINELAEALARVEQKAVPTPDVPLVKTAAAKAPEPADLTIMEPAAGAETAAIRDITADDLSVSASSGAISPVPRTPPAQNFEEDYVSLVFPAGAAELDPAITASLEAEILPLLKNNPDWRVQIQAFASDADKALGARRMSLSRALSVRSFLLEQGVEARRMDVRALGTQTDRNPADRVDFVFFGATLNQ